MASAFASGTVVRCFFMGRQHVQFHDDHLPAHATALATHGRNNVSGAFGPRGGLTCRYGLADNGARN
eukprot:125806-Lingulodinium_polyedra.AAC.1